MRVTHVSRSSSETHSRIVLEKGVEAVKNKEADIPLAHQAVIPSSENSLPWCAQSCDHLCVTVPHLGLI
jgi:hypothetical protein